MKVKTQKTAKKWPDNSFRDLVRAIDKKWGHTYEDVEWTPSIDEMLEEIKSFK